jgi:hypothetical protein
MPALLALIPGKDWLYGGLIVLLISFGIYERHHLIAEGQQHELAALKLSSDKLQKQTAIQTAELQAKATMAEQSYDKEHAALSNLPPVQPVRLCLNANRGTVVPGGAPKVAGDAATSPAAGSLQSMPAGDSTGPDIGPILSALAARADQISATLREFQSR